MAAEENKCFGEFQSVHFDLPGRSMHTKIDLQDDDLDLDLDLDLRVSDLAEGTEQFGQGTYTSPSSYAIGTRCPICC